MVFVLLLKFSVLLVHSLISLLYSVNVIQQNGEIRTVRILPVKINQSVSQHKFIMFTIINVNVLQDSFILQRNKLVEIQLAPLIKDGMALVV